MTKIMTGCPMRCNVNAISTLPACLAAVGFAALRPSARRLVHALLSTCFFILTSAACAQAARSGDKQLDQGFTHAIAMRGCTQEDAPALEIFFTNIPFSGMGEVSPPYIRVEISAAPNEIITPVSLTLMQLRRDPASVARIARAELKERESDPRWLSGTIVLNEVIPGRPVSGRYDMTTPDGRRFSNSFIADYSKRNAVCG